MLVLSACVKTEDVLTYTVSGTEVTINRCSKDATDARLADALAAVARQGYTVTSIALGAFFECSGLTNVDIPAGVTSIGDEAFLECANLTNVSIPVGVTRISARMFERCVNLTSVDIPAGVISIGEYAFSNCSGLTGVNIPTGVTSIGDYAFFDCEHLTTIAVPDSVSNMGVGVFNFCSDLKSVTVPDNMTDISAMMFAGCPSLTSIDIPSGLKRIGHNAFADCSGLTSIDIPDGLTNIGDSAFSYSGIERLFIPASVTEIGNEGFSGPKGSLGYMPYLDVIVFKHGRTNMPAHSLNGSFLRPVYIYIPNSVTSMDADAMNRANTINLTVRGMSGSYIEKWASDHKIHFEPVRSRITNSTYYARQSVPYQDSIETDTPDNAYLSFELADGALPDGLTLSKDGRFQGAPLETGIFTFDVAVYYAMFGNEKEYPMDLREIKLTINELKPGLVSNDSVLYDSEDIACRDIIPKMKSEPRKYADWYAYDIADVILTTGKVHYDIFAMEYDINDDAKQDVVAYFISSTNSGSLGNITLDVWVENDGEIPKKPFKNWILLNPKFESFEILEYVQVDILNTKTNGFHDFGVTMRVGGKPFQSVYEFDGEMYNEVKWQKFAE
jgi:hypothetical protein